RLDFHDALDHREAVESGHLDVEEDKVGLLGLNRPDGLASVGASADHFDVGIGLKAELQALDGEFLVIDDKRANGHALVPITRSPGKLVTAGSPVGFSIELRAPSGSSWSSSGISIVTVKPPSGGLSMSKRCSSP